MLPPPTTLEKDPTPGLRDYQRDVLRSIHRDAADGDDRLLVVAPTGSGKTHIFAHLIAERGGRALVLAHRGELVDQALAKIRSISPTSIVGKVQADENHSSADIVVASIQTLANPGRLQQIQRHGPIHTLVVDEAHHAPSPTWIRTIEAVEQADPDVLTIGFTATAFRDGEPLDVWDRVTHRLDIRDLVRGGHLVPARSRVVKTNMDMLTVDTVGGDYSAGSLGREIIASGAVDQIADAYLEHALGMKTIAFTPTVAVASQLRDRLTHLGVTAEIIHGATPKDDRRQALTRFRDGETQVITNCAVLTEGFDEPSVECVLIARPTTFRGLYIQMVGRGMRTHPGKTELLVLDIVGATRRHDLVTATDLGDKNDGDDDDEVAAQSGDGRVGPTHPCELCGAQLPEKSRHHRRHKNCQAESDETRLLLDSSPVNWIRVDGAIATGVPGGTLLIIPDGPPGSQEDTWTVVRFAHSRRDRLTDGPVPLDQAITIGERDATSNGTYSVSKTRWRSNPATPTQAHRILSYGVPGMSVKKILTGLTRGQAADTITGLEARKLLTRLQGPSVR